MTKDYETIASIAKSLAFFTERRMNAKQTRTKERLEFVINNEFAELAELLGYNKKETNQ